MGGKSRELQVWQRNAGAEGEASGRWWWQEGQSGVGSPANAFPLSPGLEVGLRLSSSPQHTPQVSCDQVPGRWPRIAVYAHKLSLSPPTILSSTGQRGFCRELQEPMGRRATRGKVPGSPRDCMGRTAPSCLEFHPHEEHKSLVWMPSPPPSCSAFCFPSWCYFSGVERH